jgi:hypothetical protein
VSLTARRRLRPIRPNPLMPTLTLIVGTSSEPLTPGPPSYRAGSAAISRGSPASMDRSIDRKNRETADRLGALGARSSDGGAHRGDRPTVDRGRPSSRTSPSGTGSCTSDGNSRPSVTSEHRWPSTMV